jgi:hypothetical protein
MYHLSGPLEVVGLVKLAGAGAGHLAGLLGHERETRPQELGQVVRAEGLERVGPRLPVSVQAGPGARTGLAEVARGNRPRLVLAEEPHRPGDDGEGNGVGREGADYRGVEAPKEAGVALGPEGLPQTVEGPGVARLRIRLQPGLDHVHGVDDDPGGGAREAPGQEHLPGRQGALGARQGLVSRKVDPVARGLAHQRDVEAAEDAPEARRSVDLAEALHRAREPAPSGPRLLQLQPRLGQLHRAADRRLGDTRGRTRQEAAHEVALGPGGQALLQELLALAVDPEDDGVYEGDASHRRGHAPVEAGHLLRKPGRSITSTLFTHCALRMRASSIITNPLSLSSLFLHVFIISLFLTFHLFIAHLIHPRDVNTTLQKPFSYNSLNNLYVNKVKYQL